jgi:4-amino-4-deoxy-L-arabinose transferase-like glycosyltransferase
MSHFRNDTLSSAGYRRLSGGQAPPDNLVCIPRGCDMSTIANVFERRKLAERAMSMRARSRHLIGLAGVVLLALVLNAWGLSKAGYGNTYYAAAVRSMTMSWKNFFFGAFDPGGFITVDKPPAFLWVGALSARIFGYSNWSILLPSAVAGAAAVGLLWLIVRRYFGAMAATIAGLVLALSPISVAVNRLNLPEPFLILALIGAAGAVLRSVESRRWWAWTALAGFLVGVAFNTKMLDAWIPGPALALALVVAVPTISRTSARKLLARLAVLGAVTLAVSGSWMFVVDAWPASSRPYIGGSTDNTVLDLALGYNGFNRVEGQAGAGGPGPASNTGQAQRPPGGTNGSQAQRPDGQFGQPGVQGAPAGVQPPGGQAAPGGGGSPGGFRGAGGIIAGIPGLLRMFDDANGGQIGWLLPFALGGGLVALWSWRRDPVRRAFAVLFLGWIALYGGIYSYAQGIYHAYYTSTMAPGVAALVGVGAVSAANAVRRDRRWLMVVIGLVGVTVCAQLVIAGRTPDFYGWVRPLTAATALAGVAVVVMLALRRLPVTSGVMLSVAGLLLLPAAWSWSASTNPSLNATLPQAGPQQGASGQTFGSQAFDDGTPQLAAWLKSHSDADATWQLVVSSSQNASTLIAEYRVSVMALGGFSGTDNAITVAGFADLASSGAVRYVLIGQGAGSGGDAFIGALRGAGQQGAGFRGFGGAAASGPNAVMSAVQSACTAVSDTSLPTRYQGSLYDCAGAGDAIRADAGN